MSSLPPVPPRRLLPPLFGVVVRPLRQFLALEAASGILLLLAAALAFLWANVVSADVYRAVFDYPLSLGAGEHAVRFTFRDLVNDGLMTIFFFVVGMEIKRELVVGELRTFGRAALPAVAALGGMIVPGAIYYAFNRGGPGEAGWGIPMATDIAFAVGCLTLLRRRVPEALIIFVTALAIFDDIGGIVVIAIFYGHGLDVGWLAAAATLTLVLALMCRAYVTSALVWLLAGVALWLALHHSGIHAAISGVMLGLVIPARPQRDPRDVVRELADYTARLAHRPQDTAVADAELDALTDRLTSLDAPLDRFVRALHPFVAFGIMPLFALANSGVELSALGLGALTSPVALGAGLGLLIGKQLGIFTFTIAAVKLGLAPMPGGASLAKLYGVAIVGGIGFTVAIFVASLSFPGAPALLDHAKLGILAGSIASGLIGVALLSLTKPIAR